MLLETNWLDDELFFSSPKKRTQEKKVFFSFLSMEYNVSQDLRLTFFEFSKEVR